MPTGLDSGTNSSKRPPGDIDIKTIDRIALGPWRNEDTFWLGLVEAKKLHHLGDLDPKGSALRNRLALGPLVFAGRPDTSDPDFFPFIERRTREFLTSDSIVRIAFDLTSMKTLSGRLGDGYFAIFELKLVQQQEELFLKTSFYEGGKYLKKKRGDLRKHVADILVGK
jgi:hypothetical protein